MKKEIYIVTMRCGTELEEPEVFPTKKEADKYATEYVLDFARDSYTYDTGGSPNARKSTIEKWAEENGYEYSDYYFWDGGDDAAEANVTKREIDI